ncbi:MAG: polysaccharide biosynthesis protein [Muribaculaceae bacterium]|nr:polysaccharide biosynthesis protein [Muribaculaceae bacterium]
MPSFIVLYVDILIALVATFMVFYSNPDTTPYENGDLIFTPWAKALVFTFLLSLSMMLFKTYKSIVRLSAFEDTYRIFSAIFTAAIFALACDWITSIPLKFHYFGSWNVLCISFITFAFMVAVRIIVKYIYTASSVTNNKRKRVVVLGSAINSYALATALKNETDGQFEPVLLLSIAEKGADKLAGTLPIRQYDPETIEKVFKKFNSDTLIFLSTQMEFIRNGASDVFLRNGIKLLMLNQVEEFSVDSKDSEPVISPHVQDIRIEDLLGRAPIVTEKNHIKDRIMGHTVMITGAAGSIGSEIVRQVASFGAGMIILVDQAETPMHDMQLEMNKNFPDIDIKLCIADVVNKDRMESLFVQYRPDIVYHAAAYKHVPMMECNPGEAANTNIIGTKNLADLSMKYNVEKFVMVSTDKAVNPTNVMGASKRVAEIYVQSLARQQKRNASDTYTRFITTRFGNVLGSNGSVIPLFRRQIEAGGPVTVTHRDIIRYFMTIPEACSLVLEAGCMGRGGEIYIFDMGSPVKIYDLASRMISLAGLRPNIDIQIVETGLRPGEKLYEELLNDREQTMATHHKKIMVAKVREYAYEQVCDHLEHLKSAILSNDIHEIVAEIKRIVPEFKSQNSQWGDIDKELTPEEKMHEIGTKTSNYTNN